MQIFPDFKAFCRQQSSQPSKLVSIGQSTNLLGKLLDGRYQVVQVLGAGGFSQTYLAQDIHKPSKPTCVVKHFKPASSDPSFIRTAQCLFQTEAEILEKLGQHNQIPQLLAYFEEEQNFYLLQEYIEGQPLSANIQPGCRWSESQVIQLLQEVLALLVFIHTHGVIHRDLKPDNIIQRKRDRKLVLIDFGSVKQIRTQTVTPQGHWSATIPIGTHGYIAAEQGQGNPRPNSDLYSLGIISIQALTGLIPTEFQRDPDTDEICWQQEAKVSVELASFIGRLVSYHFKDRYQSANEALEALQPLTSLQSSISSSYSPSQVEAPAQQLSTPSILLSQLPASEPRQIEVPAQQLSTSSILLSQLPTSEPSHKSVFTINSSEQAIESKNRNWIWAGISTGLASAVALSTGISTLSDKPMGDASKPNSPASASVSKSDNTSKDARNQGGATANNSNLSGSQIEKLTQAMNELVAASRLTNLNRVQSAREQPSSLSRNRQVVAATANSPVEQPQIKLIREQPSSLPRKRQVIAATPVEQPQLTSIKEISDKKLEEIAAIAKLSAENRRLNQASEALLAEVKVLKAIATTIKSSAKKHEHKISNHVSTEQPERVIATATNLSEENQEESITTSDEPASEWQARVVATRTRPFTQKQEEPITTPAKLSTQKEPLLPDTEALFAQQQEQVELSAPPPVQELATSPDSADVPAQEVETVTIPATQQQEELTATPDDAATEWQAKAMATRTRPFTQKQEEPMTTPVELPTQELATSDSTDVPAQEVEVAALPATQQQEEITATPDDGTTEWESKAMATRTRPFTQKQEEQSTQQEAPAPDFVDVAAQDLEVPLNSQSAQNSQLPSDAKNNNSSVISPDGQLLVGISTNNTIKIWNMHTGEVLNTLKGHSTKIQSLAISSDGQTLVSVAANTIKNWNLHTGELLNTSTNSLE